MLSTEPSNAASIGINIGVDYWGDKLIPVWTDKRDGNPEVYIVPGFPVGIKNLNNTIPGAYNLYQNYPNPFNPVTKIKFDIPAVETHGNVSLQIYDILGREVATLVNESLKPGSYEVEFNGSNFSSGVYFYRLVAGEYTATKKFILTK